MATYIALIHGEAGAYGIAFPDLPGCTSGGATIDEALAHVHEAAADWVEAMAAQGNDIPAPRPIETLRADPEFADDFEDLVMVAAVDIDVPGKVLRLNITLDEALLARIDRAAADAGESRSGWLATAARQRLGGERAAQHNVSAAPAVVVEAAVKAMEKFHRAASSGKVARSNYSVKVAAVKAARADKIKAGIGRSGGDKVKVSTAGKAKTGH